MKQESMDALFHALASTHRRKILDLIRGMPGCNVNDVAKYFEISRIAVMKHLGVLETANLVISHKKGRERELFVNLGPIQLIYDRWTSEYGRFWSSQAVDIKFIAEAEMAKKAAPKSKRARATNPKKRKSDS